MNELVAGGNPKIPEASASSRIQGPLQSLQAFLYNNFSKDVLLITTVST